MNPADAERLKAIVSSTGKNYYGAGAGLGVAKNIKPIDTHAAPNQRTKQPGLVDKVANVVKQGANIGTTIATETGKFIKNTPRYIKEDFAPFLKGIASTVNFEYQKDLGNIKKQEDQLTQQMATLAAQHKAGTISGDNYAKSMRDIASSMTDLSKESQSIHAKTNTAKVAESAIMTGVDILSVGSLQIAGVGGKQVAKTAVIQGSKRVVEKEVLRALTEQAATRLEQVILKSPVTRSLIERNLIKAGQIAASETLPGLIAREGKQLAVGLLIKRPLFYQSNLGEARKGLAAVMSGNYNEAAKSSAWLGIQMLEGGPLGAASKGLGWAKGLAGKLAHGKGSFIDELSSRFGDGSRTQIAKMLAESPEESKKFEEAFRVSQEIGNRGFKDNVIGAVDAFMENYAGRDLSKMSASDIAQELLNWRDADVFAKKGIDELVAAGKMTAEEAARLTPVRLSSGTRDYIAQAVYDAGDDLAARWQAVLDLADTPTAGWANNHNFMLQLERAVKEAPDALAAAKAIRAIDAASTIPNRLPKALGKGLAKFGFTLAEPVGGRNVGFIESEGLPKLITQYSSAPKLVDRVIEAIVPARLKGLHAQAKNFDTEEEFITHLKNEKITTVEQKTKVISEVQNTPPLKHFTTEETAAKLAKGEKFNYDNAPLHGTGSKEYGVKTGRFVSDGKPTLYLSLDDAKWNTASIPTGNPEIINLDKMGPDELLAYMKANKDVTASYDYTAQKYVGIKGGYKTEALKGVNYYIDPSAKTLTISSIEDLKKVSKELGVHPDDTAFWSKLRSKYDVVNIVNVDKNAKAEVDGLNEWFRAAKGDQSVILNPSKVSLEPFKSSKEIVENVSKTIAKTFDETDAREAFKLSKEGPKVSQELISPPDIFDPAIAAQPQVAAIARFLSKVGLSPEASGKEGAKKLAESVSVNLDKFGVAEHLGLAKADDMASGGQTALTKLKDFIENKAPNAVGKLVTLGTQDKSALTDLRQLTKTNIIEALSTATYKVSKEEARAIQKSIVQAYIDVPMELRGLGDRAVDHLYQINPLHKYYSRIQSALRYTYNPFFRLQESAETFIGTGISGGNRATNLVDNNLLWNKSKNELNTVAKQLDNAGIFTSSQYGEAAQDQVLGRITANITQGQKRDLAGYALDIANKRGITVDKLLAEHPDEVGDALRIVVQYGQKGILASPLARTMNLAFFPMRYNFKVTQIAAGVLAKQPPVIQAAILHSMFNMGGWLKSDEGIQWQSNHADAIQVLKWITPANSIEYTLNLLNGGPDSAAELGQLGGLPIGIISQILDSQGLIKLNKPYVDPSTGNVFPKDIPQSVKARAAVAVGDLLGSMFTYPGRTLGLPGKQSSIKKAVQLLIDTDKTQFRTDYQTDDLTPLQQNWVRVLKGDTSKEAVDALYTSPAPGQFNWYTLPPFSVPQSVIVPKKGEVLTKNQVKAMKAARSSSGSAPKTKTTAKPIGTL